MPFLGDLHHEGLPVELEHSGKPSLPVVATSTVLPSFILATKEAAPDKIEPALPRFFDAQPSIRVRGQYDGLVLTS